MSAVAAVVLAAGVSARLGCPKQLLPWGGEVLIAHVLRQVLDARVGPVAVVLGHRYEQMGRVLSPLVRSAGSRLRVVRNPAYLEGGQSSSVRAGMAAVPESASGVVFVLCDMPLVRAQHVDALVATYEELRPHRGERIIVVSACSGRRGHPVLFGRSFFGELRVLEGDEGGRRLLRDYAEAVVEVPAGEEVLVDVDTWRDYRDLLDRASRAGTAPRTPG